MPGVVEREHRRSGAPAALGARELAPAAATLAQLLAKPARAPVRCVTPHVLTAGDERRRYHYMCGRSERGIRAAVAAEQTESHRAELSRPGRGPLIARCASRRLLCFVPLVLIVLALAAWRLSMLGLGPDADSDAYGHHLLSRHLYVEPGNHAAHWVWLPLFHWLQLPLLALGGDLEWVRRANVVLWALVPLALYVHLTRPRAQNDRGAGDTSTAAALAATLLALCPLGMQLGTTGQPEPLFTLLLVVFVALAERRAYTAAALTLSALVLLRYEAWAVLGAAAAWRSISWLGERRSSEAPRLPRSAWALVLLPSASILLWAALRAPFDGGRWFSFISETRAFVERALPPARATTLGPELGHYAAVVAARAFGAGVLLAPFGLARLWRRERWLLLSSGAVLAFITFGHVRRATLGLDRHFVAVLPLYATAMAFGAALVAARSSHGAALVAARRSHGTAGVVPHRTASALTLLVCGAGALLGVGERLSAWWPRWQHAVATSYATERSIARYLDTLPTSAQIYCASPILEALVSFRPGRVAHGSLAKSRLEALAREAARGDHDIYLSAPRERLLAAPVTGRFVFEAARAPGVEHAWAEGDALAVLRLEPARAARREP